MSNRQRQKHGIRKEHTIKPLVDIVVVRVADHEVGDDALGVGAFGGEASILDKNIVEVGESGCDLWRLGNGAGDRRAELEGDEEEEDGEVGQLDAHARWGGLGGRRKGKHGVERSDMQRRELKDRLAATVTRQRRYKKGARKMSSRLKKGMDGLHWGPSF